MDPKEPSNLRSRLLAGADHGQGLLPLGRGELVTAATDPACLARGLEARAGTLAQHLPLELGKSSQHLHHHPAGRDSGIDGFGKTLERGSGLLDAFEEKQEILERSGKAI